MTSQLVINLAPYEMVHDENTLTKEGWVVIDIYNIFHWLPVHYSMFPYYQCYSVYSIHIFLNLLNLSLFIFWYSLAFSYLFVTSFIYEKYFAFGLLTSVFQSIFRFYLGTFHKSWHFVYGQFDFFLYNFCSLHYAIPILGFYKYSS